ncbi:hypothetical protein [Myxococcus xanthus]|uniref:hypothetical protein n=1 Tax=Myxococcus xanthus TaxID=34 RepID=UPI0021BC987E|nr:hypothetical protein [Myxococcus xanthus]
MMYAFRLKPCTLLVVSLGLACAGQSSQDVPDDALPGTADSGVRSPDGGDTEPDAGAEDPGVPDAGSSDAGEPGTVPPVTSARVFFSGHSLLDNPMPDHFDGIATSLGKDFNWNQQNVIGSPLRVRTWGNGGWAGYRQGKNRVGSNMNVVQELLSPQTLGPGERYDTLLITERHDLLGTIEWENTVGYLRHFHDRLIAGNPQAVTYFYHTWLDIDKANPARWIAYEKNARVAWECVSSKVNLTLQSDGRADRVVALPGSTALVDLVERVIANEVPGITGTTSQKLNVLFSDNVHLTSLGAYYMAAVHHASVFRESPEGATGPAGANAATVQTLQRIAWNFVSAYYAQPAAGERTMADCRTRIPRDVCPGFWELLGRSENVAGCQRYFGNAAPGAGGNPFVWPDPNWQPLPPP